MGDPPDCALSHPDEADIAELPSEFTLPTQQGERSLVEQIAALTSLDDELDGQPETEKG